MQREQCRPLRESLNRKIHSLLSWVTGQCPVLRQESVQLNYWWGERSEPIFSPNGPAKRRLCKRMPLNRPNKLFTTMAFIGPDHLLHYDQVTQSSLSWSWVTPAVAPKEYVTLRSYLVHAPQEAVFQRNHCRLHQEFLTACPCIPSSTSWEYRGRTVPVHRYPHTWDRPLWLWSGCQTHLGTHQCMFIPDVDLCRLVMKLVL